MIQKAHIKTELEMYEFRICKNSRLEINIHRRYNILIMIFGNKLTAAATIDTETICRY